ncbi:MAG: hypothetical protein AAGK32_22230, partial [Actinomycetota bacterium]
MAGEGVEFSVEVTDTVAPQAAGDTPELTPPAPLSAAERRAGVDDPIPMALAPDPAPVPTRRPPAWWPGVLVALGALAVVLTVAVLIG